MYNNHASHSLGPRCKSQSIWLKLFVHFLSFRSNVGIGQLQIMPWPPSLPFFPNNHFLINTTFSSISSWHTSRVNKIIRNDVGDRTDLTRGSVFVGIRLEFQPGRWLDWYRSDSTIATYQSLLELLFAKWNGDPIVSLVLPQLVTLKRRYFLHPPYINVQRRFPDMDIKAHGAYHWEPSALRPESSSRHC